MLEPRTALPWQALQWERLTGLQRDGRLPHALLLSGPEGIGKLRLAQVFAAYLLCENPSISGACGDCQACHLQGGGNHPDYRPLTVAEGKRQILVDQIRELQHFSGQRAHRLGGHKVVLIHPAEAMNINAANALLKTLEEPAADTLLILVSHASSRLLATVRSRCLHYTLPVPEADQSRRWLEASFAGDRNVPQSLQEAGGRPLLAKTLLENEGLLKFQQFDQNLAQLLGGDSHPLQLAEKMADDDILVFIDWWLRRLRALIRGALTGGEALPSPWSAWLRLPPPALFSRLDSALTVAAQLQQGAALNKRLLIESILLDWRGLCQNERLA